MKRVVLGMSIGVMVMCIASAQQKKQTASAPETLADVRRAIDKFSIQVIAAPSQLGPDRFEVLI